MRYFVVFVIFMSVGCSSIISGPSSITQKPLKPGTFIGTWSLGSASAACTTIIFEADTLRLRGIVVNDSTGEQLTIVGRWFTPVDNLGGNYFFTAHDSSNFFDDTDVSLSFTEGTYFTSNADTFYYYAERGKSLLSIYCARK